MIQDMSTASNSTAVYDSHETESTFLDSSYRQEHQIQIIKNEFDTNNRNDRANIVAINRDRYAYKTSAWFGVTVAERSVILKKSLVSWYIFVTFAIQHILIGFAWFYWKLDPNEGNSNIPIALYYFIWILISVQFVMYIYYPFYSEIVLNVENICCNENRTSSYLWTLCLLIEILHIFYLYILNITIPSICIFKKYSNNLDIWCPINDSLLFQNNNVWVSVLVMIAFFSFSIISIVVLLYMMYLDVKLYKIWQIHKEYDVTSHISPIATYNMELQPSLTDTTFTTITI